VEVVVNDEVRPNTFALVAFDMDGVLVDTSPCHAKAYQDLWLELGLVGPPYETIAGQRTIDVVRVVTAPQELSTEAMQTWTRFKQERARHYLSETPITFPDTMQCLGAMARHQQPLALATGASRRTVELVLRRLGAEELFPIVITSEDVTAGKPSPEVFTTAFARAGVDPTDALVVEDSPSGLRAGIDAGARCVSVRSGLTMNTPRFLGAYADLASLLPLLGADGA
jgi:beta-phosphoglucomutase